MEIVRAAGGVLWRCTPDGVEVCLVHRPRRDDWTLPKGKLRPGEHPLVAAVREVAEETGVRGTPVQRLPSLSYRMLGGVPKTVDFWVMRAGEAAGPTDDEVDDTAWLPVPAAVQRLTYPGDARLLTRFGSQPPATCGLVLIRHAHAGRRNTFPGPDTARPLDPRGATTAVALAGVLSVLRPVRLITATPLRCVQTLQPLGARVDLPVEVDPAFDEPLSPEDTAAVAEAGARRLTELAARGEPMVVCSQGKVIPPVLGRLAGTDSVDGFRTPKGNGWLLSFTGSRLTAQDRMSVPTP